MLRWVRIGKISQVVGQGVGEEEEGKIAKDHTRCISILRRNKPSNTNTAAT